MMSGSGGLRRRKVTSGTSVGWPPGVGKRGITADRVNESPAQGTDAFAASILDCVVQPLWVVDQAGLIQFVNAAALATLGYDAASDLVGKPRHQTIHYKYQHGPAFPVEQCPMVPPRPSGQMTHGEDWLVRKDGSMIPVEYWSVPVGMPGGHGAVVSFTDVSERLPTERALRERDAILSALAQPVWVTTHEGVIRYVNPAAVNTLGFGDASEMLGQNGHWLTHYKRPDGSPFPVEECPVQRVRATGEPLYLAEDWWVRKDGSMIPVTCTAVPIATPEGYGTAVAFTDMTARLAAEQTARDRDVARARAAELAASDARQRAILEAALDGVISIDGQGRITYLNTAAERIFGYRADEVTGRDLAEAIVPPSLREAHRAGFRGYLDTSEPRILGRRLELVGMRADGSEFPVELTITRTGPPGAPAFTGYVRDITDRQRAALELMASRARLVTASDAARQRITRDLHDGAQQRFVSTIISLQIAGQKWASEPSRARELVDLALDDAKRGLDELREIATGMHPAILTQRGLSVALTALAGRLPLPVQLDLPGRRLPDAVEASIYFFCAEALTNVVKHARADSAWVRVAADDERCTVEVRDDGIGGARAQSGSSGLVGLRDRIGALNGSMDIASPATGGTVLRAWIPLPPDLAGDAGVMP
jgi:PAS domain S-box-containing protein